MQESYAKLFSNKVTGINIFEYSNSYLNTQFLSHYRMIKKKAELGEKQKKPWLRKHFMIKERKLEHNRIFKYFRYKD